MNTPDPYERRLDRTLPDTALGAARESAIVQDGTQALDPLAVHRDPSIAPTAPTEPSEQQILQPGQPQKTIAWVRPSEMPTLLGSSWVGRGIDLQAELARRTRRSPAAASAAGSRAASRAAQRITRTAIARPAPASQTTTTTEEGLEL